MAFSLPQVRAAEGLDPTAGDDSFDTLSRDLLRDWCDGMLAVQIHDPSDPAKHGALGCPACDFIHGRCMDAVYPFLHMAKVTGQAKYLDAGVAVFEWSKNVSHDDGSWTVIADPKSWKGITVFGAIALAETLHRHGELLDAQTRQRWHERLGRAGDYLYQNFTALDFSNINYGCTGIHAMDLLGRFLERPACLERSRQLVSGLKDFLTRLYRRCTAHGLLHGGPHCISHGVKPCVHHTFTHAKALAALRDHGDLVRQIQATVPLPRAEADGVREYPEIATWLAARGPWRATVTAYDWIYHEQAQQPTGGAISMLWHQQAGPLLAGSMARYYLLEKNNMQVPPGPEHHPLTPRVELWEDDTWFTQLYDLTALVTHSDKAGTLGFEVAARLLNEARKEPSRGKAACSMSYYFDADAVTIAVIAPGVGSGSTRPQLVLPLISPTGENVTRSANRIEIHKPQGTVVIEANVPLTIQESPRPRIFNLVPGLEAVPIIAEIPADSRLECRIRFLRP